MNKFRSLYIVVLIITVSGCGGGGGGGTSVGGGGLDTTPPNVTSTSPANGATKVADNSVITATFSEDVITASAEAGFSLKETATSKVVFGSAVYNSAARTVTFTSNSPLSEYTQYTASLFGVSDFSGNYINPAYTWSFTTKDLTAPATTVSSPAGLYTTVLNLTLTCADSGSGCATTYYSVDGSTPTLVYGSPVTINEGTTNLKFYSVDNEGQVEAVQSLSYTVDLTPPKVTLPTVPAANATNVVRNSVVQATFSEAIDPTTINETTFGLDNNMSGVVTYDSTTYTATFTPTARLSCNTLYTATIGGGVSDLAGNPLGANYTWSFTSNTDCVAPVTTSTPEGGVFKGTSTSFSLSCSDAGSGCKRLVYTTDGTMPSFNPVNGTVVNGTSAGPINLGIGDSTVRYFAEDNAGNLEVMREHMFSVSNTGYLYVATSSGISRGIGPFPDNFVSKVGGSWTSKVLRDAQNNRLYRVSDNATYGTFFSDNEGKSWTEIPIAARLYYASGTRMVASVSGGLAISNDGMQTYVTRKVSDGLGSTSIIDVVVNGNMMYVLNDGGLSISSDYGVSFVNRSTTDGINSSWLYDVEVNGSNVYVATDNGLAVSNDGGVTFAMRTTTEGLGANMITQVKASGSTVYAVSSGGVSISTDNGTSFTYTPLAGGSPGAIAVDGTYVYIRSGNNLIISSDGGVTFPTSKVMTIGASAMSIIDMMVQNGVLYMAVYGDKSTIGGVVISRDHGATLEVNGLPSRDISDVYVNGSTVYAATSGGLAISTDGGATFTARTQQEESIGSNYTSSVVEYNGSLYLGTSGGLSVSSDSGATFTNYTTANGLGSSSITDLSTDGTNLYIATDGGLSYPASTGPNPFKTYTTANGLPTNYITGVHVDAGTVYVSTNGGGIAFSITGGSSWTTKTMADGLVSNTTYDIYASGSYVHVAGVGSVCISTDSGATFTENAAHAAIGGGAASYVGGQGSYVYIDGFNSLEMSSDNGATITTRDQNNGFYNPYGPRIWGTAYSP